MVKKHKKNINIENNCTISKMEIVDEKTELIKYCAFCIIELQKRSA